MSNEAPIHKVLTIVRSQPIATAEGATALLLQTTEGESIAFVVPPGAVPLLRKNLADIEAMQSHGIGNA